MDDPVCTFHVLSNGDGACSDQYNSFSGVQIKAQKFMQYDRARPQRWDEVCGHRKLHHRLGQQASPRSIQGSHRRNPEEYPVLEDDCVSEPAKPAGKYELEILSENSTLGSYLR